MPCMSTMFLLIIFQTGVFAAFGPNNVGNIRSREDALRLSLSYRGFQPSFAENIETVKMFLQTESGFS